MIGSRGYVGFLAAVPCRSNRGILTILKEGLDCEGFTLGISNSLIEAFNLKSTLHWKAQLLKHPFINLLSNWLI